jgi:5'-3' exonuclease
MSKIIAIDSGYMMHRAIFAFRNNSAVPATYTYMRMVLACLKKIGITLEDKVIIACDYGRSWRKIEDANYKAQRKAGRKAQESPEWWDEVYKEFNDFEKKLESAINWNYVKVWGLEADDWLSMISRFYSDIETIIISADRDLEQLAAFKNVKLFSPITKKYKLIKDPVKVLMEKIQGDRSDNLLEKPKTEADFERRKRIVNLLELPPHIEQPMKDVLMNLPTKNLYLNKLPYFSIREQIKQLYKLED